MLVPDLLVHHLEIGDPVRIRMKHPVSGHREVEDQVENRLGIPLVLCEIGDQDGILKMLIPDLLAHHLQIGDPAAIPMDYLVLGHREVRDKVENRFSIPLTL